MTIETTSSLVTADDLAQERALRLARVVGRAALFLVVLFFASAIGPSVSVLARGSIFVIGLIVVGLIACVGFVGTGIWFTQQHQGTWAARTIVTGILGALAVSQAIWIVGHGLDAIETTSFMIYLLPIGLSYLLGSASLMFITTAVTNGFAAILLFLLAPNVGSHYLLAEAVSGWVIITVITWLLALLIYASSRIYDQALEELGSIQKAYQRARQLDDLKDQFITHVNHELRTPIMTLQGTIEFLYDTRNEMERDIQGNLLLQANRNTQRLVTLVSSILDTRQVEQATAGENQQAVALLSVVTQAQEVVDPLAQRTFQIQVAPDVEAWGDPLLIQRILVNLLANAMKYSSAPTPIEIIATVAIKQGSPKVSPRHEVVIAVRDYGLGIPPEQIPLLFNRFVRLQRDLASNVPGSGVGLYLSQRLAVAMGGTLWVESQGIEGQGSTFYLALPIPPTQEQTTAPHPRRQQPAPRRWRLR